MSGDNQFLPPTHHYQAHLWLGLVSDFCWIWITPCHTRALSLPIGNQAIETGMIYLYNIITTYVCTETTRV